MAKRKARKYAPFILKKAHKARLAKIRKRLKIALICLLLVYVCALVFQWYNTTSKMRRFNSFSDNPFAEKYVVKGVDVSHHNTVLDWNALREQDITFVYMKATEGDSHTDREYTRHYAKAKKAGLRVGTYHFYTFCMNGNRQAEHFIRKARVMPGDMLPAIDVEHSPINQYKNDAVYKKQVIDELKILENALFRHFGKHPVIYTNNDGYKLYIKGNFPDNPLWLSDLNSEPSSAPDNWSIWQFSHTGSLQGVYGAIDLNYYRHSFDEFQQLLMP